MARRRLELGKQQAFLQSARRRSTLRPNVASAGKATLHAKAGSIPGLHLCVLAVASAGAHRGRYAAILRGQPADCPPDGARPRPSRADPTTARGCAQHRTPDPSRGTADPPLNPVRLPRRMTVRHSTVQRAGHSRIEDEVHTNIQICTCGMVARDWSGRSIGGPGRGPSCV
jgi:hypothetical protein